MKHGAELRQSWALAAKKYAQYAGQAATYLTGRGIGLADPTSLPGGGEATVADRFLLGVVVDPEPSHERFAGRLSLPYITRSGVVQIKFRCVEDHACGDVGCAKYLGLPGVKPRLYNVEDLFHGEPYIAVCEGELDALVLSTYGGIPSVAAPGASSWEPHFTRVLEGYARVLVVADADDAGREFATKLSRELDSAVTVRLPEGSDVGDVFAAKGPAGLRELVGPYLEGMQ